MGKSTGKLEENTEENAEENTMQAAVEQGGKPEQPPEVVAELGIDAAERLTIELARLRAKFGADPAIAGASFDDAWTTSPTAAMEEDEAEFIDAVADCLGVGLSLDAALNCWDSGGLFYDDGDDDDSDDVTDVSLPSVVAHPAHATGRRLVIQ
jgi:hypothetical protein